MVFMDPKDKEWSSEELKFCADCKTTKTPLWRGGPAGPKTLCNACGIRYRKRRASSAVGVSKGQEKKRERAQSSRDLRESLKMKLMALGEEVMLQRSSSVVMLGEEEQAAVCLMALSCGFVFA